MNEDTLRAVLHCENKVIEAKQAIDKLLANFRPRRLIGQECVAGIQENALELYERLEDLLNQLDKELR